MNLSKWLEILGTIGPAVLSFTPLAPIAPIVLEGVKLAEQIPGASGAQKKALVQNIVALGASGANTAAGSVVVDPTAAAAVTGTAIDSVIGVTNLVHAAHGATPATPTTGR